MDELRPVLLGDAPRRERATAAGVVDSIGVGVEFDGDGFDG
jgi:hypothetical protein